MRRQSSTCFGCTSTACGPRCSTTNRTRTIYFSRRKPWVVRRADGGFDLHLDEQERQVVAAMLTSLAAQLERDPDGPSTVRLHPPAYLEDPEFEAGYELLAGEELRTSQRQAIDVVLGSVERKRLTEGEAWTWLRALNSLRLVVGTQLGIDADDDHGPTERGQVDPGLETLWALYDFATLLQYALVEAISD